MNKLRRLDAASVLVWALVGYVTLVATLRSPRFAGDTVAMTQSAQFLVNCAKAGKFLGCPGANQYGVLQNIPALFLVWKGQTLEATVAVIGFLNIAAFLGLAALLWRTFSGPMRQFAVLAMLAGPLVGYVSLTFGEMLQTLVFVSFVIALSRSKWIWVVLTGILAASTRETAFLPLILISTGIIWTTQPNSRRDRINSSLWATSGILGGVVLITLFNYWKFGTWRNLGNLNSLYITPGIPRKIDSGIAIWFAPGGGVLPFWLLGGLLSLGLLVTVLVIGNRERRISALFIGAGLGANTASLAMWFAPFGWVAWGPRLMIPTVACVAIANMIVFGEVLRPTYGLKTASRSLLCAFVAAAAAISALPSFGYMRAPGVIDRFFSPDKVCNKVAIIQEDPAYYFKCLHHGAWKTSPSLWSTGLDGVTRWEILAILVVFAALWATLNSLLGGVGTQVKNLNQPVTVDHDLLA